MRITKRSLLWLGAPVLLLALGAAGVNLMNHSERVLVPAGTEVEVRLDQSLTTKRNISGDAFRATMVEPIIIDGKTVIPEGATATGRIVYARQAGRLRGTARMQLALESVEVGGQEYEFQTSTFVRRGGNHKNRNLAFIGGGAGGGALIGAIAAGGKGALIGGPIGAGAGVAAAAITGKRGIFIPAETRLSFRLAKPAEIEVKS
jgi:hypothetical protein